MATNDKDHLHGEEFDTLLNEARGLGRAQSRKSRLLLFWQYAVIALLFSSYLLLLYSYIRDVRTAPRFRVNESEVNYSDAYEAAAPVALAELKSLLTVEVYLLMADTWLPWDKHEPIDYGKAIQQTFFQGKEYREKIRPTIYPILKAISELGLDNVPNMMTFLPDPEDPEFPLQAFGLQLLLDQAPRSLLKGINVRWTYAYFGEISIRYVQQLEALPPHLDPRSWERWNVSVDYWVWTRLYWGAPIVHNERWAEKAIAFTEATREFVEQKYQTRDPYRDHPEKRWDLYGFPKMLSEGAPEKPGVAEGWFWLACLMDVHYPLLKRYGRYPYQNGAFGRTPTADEEEWCKMTDWNKMCWPEGAERIREDVEAGRWTPLGIGEQMG